MAENTTLARPYAQAIVSLAKESEQLQHWSDMLAFLESVTIDPVMSELIDNPNIHDNEILTLLGEVCGTHIDEGGKQFLKVLVENGRLGIITEIRTLFEIEKAAVEGSIKAEVVSALTLSEIQKASLAAALQKRLGREVTLECEVDASLLGGAIIRAGDLVIDGSASGKLSRLSADLLH